MRTADRCVEAKCTILTTEAEVRVRDLLNRLTNKWSLWALSVLSTTKGPMRFSHLRREVGVISQKSLTLTLRSLEEDGLVTREVFAEVPPRVEYTLTALAHELLQNITPIWTWVANNHLRFANNELLQSDLRHVRINREASGDTVQSRRNSPLPAVKAKRSQGLSSRSRN